MADTKIIPISADFDLKNMVAKLTQTYQAKGFDVTAMQLGTGISIDFKKDDDGIKKFIGLALAIKANITLNENTMMINFTDAEWMGKIIALGIGWLLCLVPAFLGGYGAVKQLELPKTIGNDIQMIVGGGPQAYL